MEKTLWENEWLEVYLKDDWYTCVRAGDGVGILPYTSAGDGTYKFLVRKEHCPPYLTKDTGLVLTAITGQMDAGETPLQTAARELEEEAGYKVRPDQFESMGWFYPTKHSSDKMHIFAVNLMGRKFTAPKGDGTRGEESASCVWVSKSTLLSIPSPVLSWAYLSLIEESYA